MTEKNHLQIIVHDDDQITVRDERGMPVLCKDCRFSGWLTSWHFDDARDPCHCLLYSGGANPRTGSRVFDETITGWMDADRIQYNKSQQYPKCIDRNRDGACKDFVPAKKLPWWKRWFRSRRRIRT